MALRNAFDGHQAIGEAAALGHTLLVDHHADVVGRVQADIARRILMGNQLHGHALL
ncbi:hypothetical protein D3C71_1915730 [compost metagenome]